MILLDPKVLERRFSQKAQMSSVTRRADWVRRLRLLSAHDRILVQLVQHNGVKQRDLAALMGINSGNFSRRIRKLLDRLNDPLVAALEDPECSLDEAHRRIGLDYFLGARTVNELARERGITADRARVMIEFVRGWFRGLSRGRGMEDGR